MIVNRSPAKSRYVVFTRRMSPLGLFMKATRRVPVLKGLSFAARAKAMGQLWATLPESDHAILARAAASRIERVKRRVISGYKRKKTPRDRFFTKYYCKVMHLPKRERFAELHKRFREQQAARIIHKAAASPSPSRKPNPTKSGGSGRRRPSSLPQQSHEKGGPTAHGRKKKKKKKDVQLGAQPAPITLPKPRKLFSFLRTALKRKRRPSTKRKQKKGSIRRGSR